MHHKIICLFLLLQVNKKNKNFLFGRNDRGIAVIFPDNEISDGSNRRPPKPGDYVQVKVNVNILIFMST